MYAHAHASSRFSSLDASLSSAKIPFDQIRCRGPPLPNLTFMDCLKKAQLFSFDVHIVSINYELDAYYILAHRLLHPDVHGVRRLA